MHVHACVCMCMHVLIPVKLLCSETPVGRSVRFGSVRFGSVRFGSQIPWYGSIVVVTLLARYVLSSESMSIDRALEGEERARKKEQENGLNSGRRRSTLSICSGGMMYKS